MGVLRSLSTIFVYLITSQACAAELPAATHFVGRYDFDWNGIRLGYLVLGMDETADSYKLHLDVFSAGIVNLFTRHSSDTQASGKRSGNTYLPQHYESHYKTKDKPRHLKLEFDDKEVVKEEIVEPPEDPTQRPVVPHTLKDGSYDPLTLLMAVRAGVEKCRSFDVKHLYEVHVVPGDRGILRLSLGKRPAASYILSRIPLGGMTAKETKAYAKGEPPLTLFFSDDARHIPLGVSVPLYFGVVRGLLVKECTTFEECLN